MKRFHLSAIDSTQKAPWIWGLNICLFSDNLQKLLKNAVDLPVVSNSVALFIMTSSNGNIFRVTGPLCGEFTGPGEFPTQRPVTRSFDVFFDLRPNKRVGKQPWGWWFGTPSWSLWRQCNGYVIIPLIYFMNSTIEYQHHTALFIHYSCLLLLNQCFYMTNAVCNIICIGHWFAMWCGHTSHEEVLGASLLRADWLILEILSK